MAEELEGWKRRAQEWLAQQCEPRPPAKDLRWGEGSDSVALFRNLTADQELAQVRELQAWQRTKQDAGYGSIAWPVEYGGAGLSPALEAWFANTERGYLVPDGHEAMAISLELVGPTILTCGTDEQKERYLPPLRRADEHWCQLFSEPGAGSDLAGLTTRAVRDGDGWRITGQKVWTSGAQLATHGYILTRTDPDAARHAGITAFLLDMRAPGVQVRPLRQMSGGSSFNEVFLDEVRVPDAGRVGEVGGGWKVAITTLGFERMATARPSGGGPDHVELLRLAAHELGTIDRPAVRQTLTELWMQRRVRSWTMRRAVAAVKAGGVPGPEGSIGKLAVTEGMRALSDAATLILGPALQADTGRWGTYAWSEYVNGAPGFRVAGGTDEVQRNIIAERVLGLPRSPA